MMRHTLAQPVARVVGQLTVRLPFRPGPNIDPNGVSAGSGMAVGEALASRLGVDVGESDASTDGLGETVGDGLGDTVGDGLAAVAFVTLITNRLWHDCEPQPVIVAIRTTLLPARSDVSMSRFEGSRDSDTRPGSMVQSALIRRGSMSRPLHVYCNFSVVFPSAISPGIPRTAQSLGSCTVRGGVCCGRCNVNAAAMIRAVFVSSGPDCTAMFGSVESFDPRSISVEIVFVGRKL